MRTIRYVVGRLLITMVSRILFVFVYFFSFFIPSLAKDYVDSLETKLILVDNDQKLLILNELIPYYVRNEPLTALNKAQKMKSISSLENDLQYSIRAKRYIGFIKAHLKSDYDSALLEYSKIEQEARSLGIIREVILTKLASADIYFLIIEASI